MPADITPARRLGHSVEWSAQPAAAAGIFGGPSGSPSQALPGSDRAVPTNPIILLAVRSRSGSNYLNALLSLHPDIHKSRVPEDFFLANSATLISFCQSLTESWKQDWYMEGRADDTARLMATLGTALMQFVTPIKPEAGTTCDRHVLLRTPHSDGIQSAGMLFPNAKVVVLVRDGPATVESGRKSFDERYEVAMRKWRDSVRRILSVLAGDDSERYHLVRFEDIVTDPIREISQILDFIGLDRGLYPFDQIDAVPVVGSSTFGRQNGEPVHWRPVERDPSFDPLARGRSWPRHRLKRFSWLAGPELRRLGYPVQALSTLDRLWNVASDGLYPFWRAGSHIFTLRPRQPRVISDRQRRYLSWRKFY